MDNIHNLTDTTLGEHIGYLKERIDRDTELYQRQVSILNNWYSSVDAKRNAQWGVRYYNQSIYRWMQELSDLKRRLLRERARSSHTGVGAAAAATPVARSDASVKRSVYSHSIVALFSSPLGMV